MSDFRRIAIVGMGAVGGSFGLALKQASLGIHLVGIDGARTLDKAKRLGVIDSAYTSLPEGISGADFVLLTSPTHEIEGLISQISAEVPQGVIISDISPVKLKIVSRITSDDNRQFNYVGLHLLRKLPENGLEQAYPDLFLGATIFMTPAQRKDMEAFDRVKTLFEAVGTRVIGMTPEAHDQLFAEIQQLPHLLTAAYLHFMFSKEPADRPPTEAFHPSLLAQIRSLAEFPSDSSGEADANRDNIARALRSFGKHLGTVTREVENGNAQSEMELGKNRSLQLLGDQGYRAMIPAIRVSLPKGGRSLSRIAEVLARSNIVVRQVDGGKFKEGDSVRILFNDESDADNALKCLGGSGFQVWKLEQ